MLKLELLGQLLRQRDITYRSCPGQSAIVYSSLEEDALSPLLQADRDVENALGSDASWRAPSARTETLVVIARVAGSARDTTRAERRKEDMANIFWRKGAREAK